LRPSRPAGTGCWLCSTPERRPGSRIGLKQVDVIREAFAGFQETDVMRGGGHARQPLAEYLTSRVLPLLQDVDPHSEAGGALFPAASERTTPLGNLSDHETEQVHRWAHRMLA
jgi:hypothetical protein